MSKPQWILIGLFVFSLYISYSTCRIAYRIWGRNALRLGGRVLRLRLRQPFGFGGLRYVLFVIVLALLVGSGGWTSVLTLFILGSQIVLLAQPPLLVFLAASRPASQQLYGTLRWATPGHTMALIRQRMLDRFFHASSWRTRDELWAATVTELVRIAKIVAVDTRTSSAALVQEARWICQSTPAAAAVLWITEDNGTGALLDAAAREGIDLIACGGTMTPISQASKAVARESGRWLA